VELTRSRSRALKGRPINPLPVSARVQSAKNVKSQPDTEMVSPSHAIQITPVSLPRHARRLCVNPNIANDLSPPAILTYLLRVPFCVQRQRAVRFGSRGARRA